MEKSFLCWNVTRTDKILEMPKILFFAFVIVLSVVSGSILTTNDDLNKEIAPIDTEGRILLEVPIIATIVLKTLKAIWFFLSNIGSIFDLKMGLVSLAVTTISWAYNNCFSLVLGAGVVIGLCKLTGLCTLNNKLDIVSDTLSYAVNNLDLGTLKYGSK